MDNGYTKQVRERISMAEDGTVFATSGFAWTLQIQHPSVRV